MKCYRRSESERDRHYEAAYEQLVNLIGQLQAPEAQLFSHGEAEERIATEGSELKANSYP